MAVVGGTNWHISGTVGRSDRGVHGGPEVGHAQVGVVRHRRLVAGVAHELLAMLGRDPSPGEECPGRVARGLEVHQPLVGPVGDLRGLEPSLPWFASVFHLDGNEPRDLIVKAAAETGPPIDNGQRRKLGAYDVSAG